MTSDFSLRAAYGKHVLYEAMLKKYQHYDKNAGQTLPNAPPKLESGSKDSSWSPGRVCIVGAGAAGLATAIYIHDACVKAGVTRPVIDIYEATDRPGGRVYTYQFTDTANPATHNYYDVGAMRIPDILTMQSTFQMINYLIEKKQDVVKKPYIYNDPESREPLMYYHRQYQPSDVTKALEPFAQLIKPFICKFADATTPMEWNDCFTDMVGDYDKYSTRAYLTLGNATPSTSDTSNKSNNWNYQQTETAETFDTSTGLFDQAWMETVCDYADFQAASLPGIKWWRLEDSQAKYGMQALTNAMENYLKTLCDNININYNSPVTTLVYNQTDISVTVDGAAPKLYETVINTTTMGCLGRMDIKGLALSDDVLTGIRALSYDRATKVAIKFESDWWTPLLNNQPSRNQSSEGPGTQANFLGGISSTDLPIRTVVYPSWQDSGSTVLMISYAWAQDATRLTSLIPNYAGVTQTKIDPIADLCLRSLAELWAQVPEAPDYSRLQELYQSHHAFAWANDPHTAGAFALFGPGQFSYLYPLMQQPQCRGDGTNKVGFYFAGEATSAHHAWISGAFDSAYTTVWQWAGIQHAPCSDLKNPVQQAMYDLPFGKGPKEHVAEMNEGLLNWANWASTQHGKRKTGV